MKVARILHWRWLPKHFRAQDPDAPYRDVVHLGFWLFFFGGKDE